MASHIKKIGGGGASTSTHDATVNVKAATGLLAETTTKVLISETADVVTVQFKLFNIASFSGTNETLKLEAAIPAQFLPEDVATTILVPLNIITPSGIAFLYIESNGDIVISSNVDGDGFANAAAIEVYDTCFSYIKTAFPA